jgi:hypothetical protein
MPGSELRPKLAEIGTLFGGTRGDRGGSPDAPPPLEVVADVGRADCCCSFTLNADVGVTMESFAVFPALLLPWSDLAD